MTDYYWISGGANQWNQYSQDNWSTDPTSSRSYPSGNLNLPTALDNVFFDQYSGSASVKFSAAMNCRNLSTIGFTGNFAGGGVGAYNIRVNGPSANLGTAVFGPTGITLQGTNCTYQQLSAGPARLQISVVSTATLNSSCTPGSIIHEQGTFDVGNNAVTTGAYTHNLEPGLPAVLNMGSNTWTITSAGISWYPRVTSFTLNAQTSNIVWYINVGANASFYAVGKTYNTLTIGATRGIASNYDILSGGTFSQIVYTKTALNLLRFDNTNTTTVNSFGTSGNVYNASWSGYLTTSLGLNDSTVNIYGIGTDNMSNMSTYLPTTGSIKIDNEIITYSGRTVDIFSNTASFTGCSRGANGTNPDSHISGVVVSVPIWLYIRSISPGSQATVNTTTGNGVFYAGFNSKNDGNNTGIIFNNQGDGITDYVIFQDINIQVTGDTVKRRAFFNLF